MGLLLNTFLILYLFNFFHTGDLAVDFHLQKNYHEPRAFSSEELTEVASLSSLPRFEEILSHILIPRVVGTDGHKKVREYITTQLRGLGWSVEHQESVQSTPLFGPLTFSNIIARLNPSAERYLTLACHYDSKHMREGEFMAATDSAVPCAMMVDMAQALKHKLGPFKQSNLSLMLVFFDGEEAFVKWSATDSLYGSRSLAQTWEQSKYPHARSKTNELHRMDLLVLLDLLGTPQPTFYNYFRKTQHWYLRMADAEKTLTEMRLLKKKNNEVYFIKGHLNAHIDDDHMPFLDRDVPCLHIIPTPFPTVWHELSDNYNALDMPTIDNLNKIFRDLLVLLDLLGYKNPTFISSFADTHKWYQWIMSAEQRLHKQGLLLNHPRPYFFDFQLNLGVGDDHIPFMERGVPVVHVIPTPFPEVWHELSDNYENLDFDVIHNLINIFYLFTLEYLEGTIIHPTIEEL